MYTSYMDQSIYLSTYIKIQYINIYSIYICKEATKTFPHLEIAQWVSEPSEMKTILHTITYS